jgi:hypothetical protein
MTKAMGQVPLVQKFDQQLYAIAKQVEWAIPETSRNHIVRLGGFHTLSCYIAAIGKLWGDEVCKTLPKIQIYILINRCYSRSKKEFAGVGLLGSELECQEFF